MVIVRLLGFQSALKNSNIGFQGPFEIDHAHKHRPQRIEGKLAKALMCIESANALVDRASQRPEAADPSGGRERPGLSAADYSAAGLSGAGCNAP